MKSVFEKIDLIQRICNNMSPVSDFLKLRKGNYPTIYELLTHTAGYHHLTPIEITVPRLIRHRYIYRNIYENVTANDVIKALERRNISKRKHFYGYSDFPYAVLAIIIENIKKQPFSLLLENFLCETLNMHNTTVSRQKEFPKAVCNGKIIPYWKWENNNPYIASGGLVSNITDMLKYLEIEIQSDNHFITKAHEICQNSFNSSKNIGTCIGWHTYKKSNQLWHVGGVGTFRSSIIVNKKTKTGVVVLGNTKGKKSANVHYIAKMLYSDIKTNKINL